MLTEINETILKNIRPLLSEAFSSNAKEMETAQAQSGEIEEIQEELDARFDNLPEEIKKIIIESGYHQKLYNLATENKLTVPQMGALEEAATGVIVGSVHPENFEAKIKEGTGLTGEMTQKLAGEINQKILKPIREKMESSYNRPSVVTEIKPAGIKIIRADLSIPELNAGDEK